DLITYWYDDHKTHKRVTVTEHVFDLFAKIIRHIPNKHFKTISYYGLYTAKNHRYSSYYEKLHKLEKIRALMHLMKKTYRVSPIRGKEDE
ncbi:MAG: transposase, partial [Bacilli bacterium]|nr:transposase [Bacilli bacterium]